MPKRPSLTPVFNEERNRWRLDIPPSLSTSGKRLRSYFKSRKDAREHGDKLLGDAPAATIAPTLAMEADKARSLLDPLGVDLVQAARVYVEAHALLVETGGSITQAARAYRDVWQTRNSSSPFGEAVVLYLASRSDLRDSTLASYNYTLDSVFRPLHDRMLSDLTTADLEGILSEKGPTAARMHHRNLGVFWRWAAKPPRSWATLEVMQATETPRVSSDADIKIFNVHEVKALLSAAEAEGPGAAVAFAVAIFGGVRMAELERLTWADVLADHIEIGKSVAKKHSRRLIPICPTLRRWIDDYRDGCEESSPLVPSNWTEASKNVRRRAGWAVEAYRPAEEHRDSAARREQSQLAHEDEAGQTCHAKTHDPSSKRSRGVRRCDQEALRQGRDRVTAARSLAAAEDLMGVVPVPTMAMSTPRPPSVCCQRHCSAVEPGALSVKPGHLGGIGHNTGTGPIC